MFCTQDALFIKSDNYFSLFFPLNTNSSPSGVVIELKFPYFWQIEMAHIFQSIGLNILRNHKSELWPVFEKWPIPFWICYLSYSTPRQLVFVEYFLLLKSLFLSLSLSLDITTGNHSGLDFSSYNSCISFFLNVFFPLAYRLVFCYNSNSTTKCYILYSGQPNKKKNERKITVCI